MNRLREGYMRLNISINAGISTLVELLQSRADDQYSQCGYRFLADDEKKEVHLSYSELDRRARSIGALLQGNGGAGKPVLLLYPPGLDYISAFFGCLYAGAIAVPLFPPHPRRPMPRLQAVVADVQATLVLTTSQIHADMEQRLIHLPELMALQWLSTDTITESLHDQWQDPHITQDTVAFLQYTSGSVGTPKGVMLTHGNLLHNSSFIYHHCGHSPTSSGVSWLPPYHDMGLIGGILQPLYGRFPITLMSPAAFLQRPFRWLQAISRYRATTSGGPNFAYDLCVRAIPPEQREELDLSCWEVAFSGAENVRSETLDRFASAFASCGFRQKAWYPSYGLAEATLFVAGGKKLTDPTICEFNTAALELNHAVKVSTEEQSASRSLVGYYVDSRHQRLQITHPQRMTPCKPGEVGEIWVSGPSIAQGYWDQPTETRETFQATLVNTGEGPFLRTGDLGFLYDGDLFVTGRLKDIIVIRGRNHYPQDIELTAERVHSALRPGCGAAFSVEIDGAEQLVIVYEIERQHRHMDTEEVCSAIRRAVAEHHELQTYAILLIKPGSIPKTSSGKIQHQACRAQFLAGTLAVVGKSTLEKTWSTQDDVLRERETLLKATLEERKHILVPFLQGQVARILGIDFQKVGPQQSLSTFGLDSLMAFELKNQIETVLGAEVPVVIFLQGDSLDQIITRILAALEMAPPPIPVLSGGPHDFEGALPLTPGQQALWFLHQIDPENTAYTIAHAVNIHGALDSSALHEALRALVHRHQALRTSFASQETDVVQIIHRQGTIFFQVEDASTWSREHLDVVITGLACQPFDLTQQPLLRVHLFHKSPHEHILLFAIHHIVADLWSLTVFVDELRHLYAAAKNKQAMPLKPLSWQYSDYIQWQLEMLAGVEGERQWVYWQKQLAGELPTLALPTDHVRPSVQIYHGAAQTFTMGASLTQRLKSLARREGVTLYTLLLATFLTLLYRHTNQEDILIGSPTTGRSRSEVEDLVGYFVNPVVIRAGIVGDVSFQIFLQQVQQNVLAALAHQDYPFPLLVERLQPRRNPNSTPIFQVMFALQQAYKLEQLSAFVLNDPAGRIALDDLEVRPWPLKKQTAMFDMTLEIVDNKQDLYGRFEYNRDLFEPSTINSMLTHFQTLLEGIVTHPQQRIVDLPLLSKDEHQHILVDLNATDTAYPAEMCAHELVSMQAVKTPGAIVMISQQEVLTYQELNQRANQLAHYLCTRGVGPEIAVGVYMERSVEFVVALLAILKAGGAYVPLDPSTPQERLALVLEEIQAPIVLTHQHLAEYLSVPKPALFCLDTQWEMIAAQPITPPKKRVATSNLAYIIYTSGSTGRPKGTEITHQALLNLIFWHLRTFAVSEADRATQVAGLGFDAVVWELWPYLSCGASISLPNEETRISPTLLRDWLIEHAITITFLPTPIAEHMLELDWSQNTTLRFLLTGGDTLHAIPVSSLPFTLVNNYGPTENTVVASSCVVLCDPQAEYAPPIGRPISNVQLYLLDHCLRPVPLGVIGDLYIGGDGLARGYLKHPALTAERFIPHPFSTEPGTRLYKTGDLARYLPDGNIEFQGRSDSQIKILGNRIESGEIEAELKQHLVVKDALVMAHVEEVSGEKRLVAYVVPEAENMLTGTDLRSYLRKRLPEYMVPSAFMLLQALPLTPNGKVDRRALPTPEWIRSTKTSALPRTATEEVLADIWAEVLDRNREQTGIYDNFFELGGHSLLATRVQTRIQKMMRIDMSLQTFFTQPIIADLASWIDTHRANLHEHKTISIPPAPRSARLPLSFAQKRLWLLDLLIPGNTAYNISGAARLKGDLDIGVLERSLNEVIRRHESLRTTFVSEEGQPRQLISSQLTLSLPIHDVQALTQERREEIVQQQALVAAKEPFDLAHGPLIRTQVLRLNEQEHVLLLTIHHVVADGWSLGILVQEVSALYAAFIKGQPSPLPTLSIQYADYAVWQQTLLQDEILEQHLAYWRQQLSGSLPQVDLPTDSQRSTVQNFLGAQQVRTLDKQVTAALKTLNQQENVTLFMLLLAAFQVLLHRLSGQDDIIVGTPVAGRTHTEIEDLIGCFINTLALRTDLSGNPSFRELLQRVRATVLGAQDHQDLPFERLLEELQPERSLNRSPLFDVMLNFINTPPLTFQMPGLDITLLSIPEPESKFAMTLYVEPLEEELTLRLVYQRTLFSAERISSFLDQFLSLLEQIVAAAEKPINAYSLVTPRAQHLLPQLQQTLTEPTYMSVLSSLAYWTDRSPKHVAVRQADQQWSYKELSTAARNIGETLLAHGLEKGDVVAITGVQSFGLISSMLGVLLSGGVFLALDRHLPYQRQQLMLKESGTKYVVMVDDHQIGAPVTSFPSPAGTDTCIYVDSLDGHVRGGVQHAEALHTKLPTLQSDDAAYLFFTSGTTGTPKAVLGCHKGLAHFLDWQRSTFSVGQNDRVAQLTALSFDVVLRDIFLPLTSGATLCLPEEDDVLLPERIIPWLARERITVIHTVPTLAQSWLSNLPSNVALPALRLIFFAGEALKSTLVQRWCNMFGKACRMVNLYGPTETTLAKCYYEVSDELQPGILPVGQALPETQALILGANNQLCGIGEPGEIVIRTPFRSLGYINASEENLRHFRKNPFGNNEHDLLYFTGDRGRYSPKGLLEILGRIDDQVKIRGIRIELKEIESILTQHSALRDAVVVAHKDTYDYTRLIAYIVPDRQQICEIAQIRRFLYDRLPTYMVPSAFVLLDTLPVTSNGKIDRGNLPLPDTTSLEPATSFVAPRTPIERDLAIAWAALLQVDSVGVHDSFFDLGGHSLLAAQLISRVREDFGVELRLRDLFITPTIEKMAEQVEIALLMGVEEEEIAEILSLLEER